MSKVGVGGRGHDLMAFQTQSNGNAHLCTHKLYTSPHAYSQTLDSDLILMAVIWCNSSSKERMMVRDKKKAKNRKVLVFLKCLD